MEVIDDDKKEENKKEGIFNPISNNVKGRNKFLKKSLSIISEKKKIKKSFSSIFPVIEKEKILLKWNLLQLKKMITIIL